MKSAVILACVLFQVSVYAGPNEDLFNAVVRGNVARVKAALKAGADANYKGSDGRNISVLMTASAAKSPEIVALLLAKGANVNAKNFLDTTPLMYAVQENRADIVRLLIARKADTNAKERYGNTALKMASEKGNTQIVELLEKAGAKHTPVASATQATVATQASTSTKQPAFVQDPKKIERHKAIMVELKELNKDIARLDAEINALYLAMNTPKYNCDRECINARAKNRAQENTFQSSMDADKMRLLEVQKQRANDSFQYLYKEAVALDKNLYPKK